MNTYNVYRNGHKAERVQADEFSVEPDVGVTFWRNVPRPGSPTNRRSRESYAFYGSVDKVLPAEPEVVEAPKAGDKPGSGVLIATEEERERLATLLLRCKSLVAQWERWSPLSVKRALELVKADVEALEPLEDRLQDLESDDDEDFGDGD